MKLPDWNDDKALAAWVSRHLPAPAHDYLLMPWHQWWGAPFTELDRQREALAAARQGNFKLLGTLKAQGVSLSTGAETLITDLLLGTFKVEKPSGKKTGRPKMTEAQRRASNPIHGAREEVQPIEDLLREHYYSGQRGHHERAIDMAAYRAKVDRERLAKHLQSKHILLSPTKL